MTDLDAITLSGHDFDCIVDAVDEAETAICALLQELHGQRNGLVPSWEESLGALMNLNTAIRITMQTIVSARKRQREGGAES